jgi:hypothetical protein
VEIVDFTNQVIEELEKAFRCSKDPKVAASKPPPSIVKATSLLQDSKAEESKLEMRKVVESLQTTLNPLDTVTRARLGEFYKGKDPEQVKLWRRFLDSFSSNLGGFADAWDILAKNAMGDSAAEAIKSSNDNESSTTDPGKIFSNFLQILPLIAP